MLEWGKGSKPQVMQRVTTHSGEDAFEEVMAEGIPCTGEGVCHLQRRKIVSRAKHMQRPSNVSTCWVCGNSEWYVEPRLQRKRKPDKTFMWYLASQMIVTSRVHSINSSPTSMECPLLVRQVGGAYRGYTERSEHWIPPSMGSQTSGGGNMCTYEL